MRLYHSKILLVLAFALFLGACTSGITETKPILQVEVKADGQVRQVQLSPGDTVQEALTNLGITMGSLDRVEPPSYTVLTDMATIELTRVWEEFEVEQIELTFEQKMQPSEFLPEGDQQPLQLGENGLQEITYRKVFEDGVEISKSPIKSVVVKEPVDQIILVGVQTSYTPLTIPGRLIYLSEGNAWMLEGTTSNRIPLIGTGDLDGRIFTLSEDGKWFLYTRRSDDEDIINTLWVVEIANPAFEINLQIDNVIHFADWVPGSSSRIAYSTVEIRQAAPGWQANNNLVYRDFSVNAWVSTPQVGIPTNSGGVYGWWGTAFVYSPINLKLAYVGPDQVGVSEINAEDDEIQTPYLEITPLQTRGNWAWVPGVRWSPDGNILFTVNHAPPPGSVSPEESPNFDLTAISLINGEPISMVTDVGMFAYPIPSPIQIFPSGEAGYQVAYLQAIFPTQSETSRYRLTLMDRDGSNKALLFPPPEAPGIEPQSDWGAWSPDILSNTGNHALALIYQGNIWLIDPHTGEAWQITGDGSINRMDWQ